MSYTKNRLIFGIGINDSKTPISIYNNGKQEVCEYYKAWKRMLQRCYSNEYIEDNPTYKDCYVSNSWLLFSNFKVWMKQQDWKGKVLDKDILKPNNKLYSKDTCIFIDVAINGLLNSSSKTRGAYPQGVHYLKSNSRFIARLSISGKSKYLGCFKSSKEASQAYIEAKTKQILKIANEQVDSRIKKGLILHAAKLSGGYNYFSIPESSI